MKPKFSLTQTTIVVATCCSLNAVAAEKLERIGSWDYRTLEDKMEDKLRYIAVAHGTNGSLALKCDSVGQKSIYVGFYADRFLGKGPNGWRQFRYRIDKNPPESDEWSYDKSSAHQFDHSKADKFAQKLINGTTLLIQAITYDYETVETEMGIDGAARAIERLRKDCKN